MLETPSIRRYSFMSHPFRTVWGMGSENPIGADNQQERPASFANTASKEVLVVGVIRESSEAIRKAPFRSRGKKIWSIPHGDMGSYMNYNG
jgi:hypothetical protein